MATERRKVTRKRVHFGALAEKEGRVSECVISDYSADGARVTLKRNSDVGDELAISVPNKGKAHKARIVWADGTHSGVTFTGRAKPVGSSSDDLEEQLRRAKKSVRRLKARVNQLSGG